MEPAPAIGIDLGATFSKAAVYRKGRCEIIPNKEGQRLTPSFVFYHPNNLEVSVGSTAHKKGLQKIENFLFDIKRIIGRKYDDVYVQELKKSDEYRYKIIRGENDKAEIQIMFYDGVTVCKTPEEISSEILKYLKESANEYLGVKVTEAVISIPAHFSNAQRKATRAAAELAGLKVLKLITEPVAAAIHYCEDRLNKQSNLLVFDFGGGTLDVSIIEVHGKTFAVKSVEGDTFLGGRDFDQLLLQYFKSAVTRQFGNIFAFDKHLLRRINDACVRLKTKLSISQNYSFHLQYIGANKSQSFTLSMMRTDFEELTHNLFARAINLVDKCLNEAGMTKKDVTDVVLVGGTTRIPKVRETLSSYFSNEELRTDLNPDEAVALGAAIQAALFKEKNQELEKYKVTEITPLSLGLDLDGLMVIALKKNSLLPLKSTLTCNTSENNQKSASFNIFEGERKNCKYNNLLGSFILENLPPGRSGEVSFVVVFTLNEDGILEVDAREVTTGNKSKLILTIDEFRLCDNKIRHTIENAEQNKKDDEIFETFIHYRWEVQRHSQHVIYDLQKISCSTDRDFVKSKCETFAEDIEQLKYTELDKLKLKYSTFKKSIIGIVQDVIDVKF